VIFTRLGQCAALYSLAGKAPADRRERAPRGRAIAGDAILEVALL
jgi:hypothetical protein